MKALWKIFAWLISSGVVTTGCVFSTNKYLTLRRELIRELKYREEILKKSN